MENISDKPIESLPTEQSPNEDEALDPRIQVCSIFQILLTL